MTYNDEIYDTLKTCRDKQMNILMIFSDQHNAAMAGYRGHPIVRTPNLDKFASESSIFTNAYCNSPLCSPSRQSFMAGLYCHDIGVWNNTCAMPEDTVTWAHALSASGYETSLIGKMHFNGYQKMYGFDKRPVLEGSNAGKSFYSWGVRASHSWKDPLPYLSGNDGMRTELLEAGPDVPERQPIFQKDYEILEGTLEQLKEKGQDKDGKPWAICSAFVLPHPPWRPREDLFKSYEGKGDLPVNHKGEDRDICDQYLQKFYGNVKDLPEDAIRRARESYYALITEFDEIAGKIFDSLEENGLADNTVVFYFTDHGEMAGKHGNWSKVSLLEDSVRIPLLVRWPGVSKPGVEIHEPVSMVDLYPTFLDIAGTQLPEPLQLRGHSLTPLLEGNNDAFAGEHVFGEFEGEGWNHPRAFIREGDWKYVHNHEGDYRLYNLADDPDELKNLAEDSVHAERIEKLRAKMFAHWHPEAIEDEVIATQTRMQLAYNKNINADLGW